MNNRYISYIESRSNVRSGYPSAKPLRKPRKGYYVTIWHRGARHFQKWFGVNKYGTKAAALKAARAARDQVLRELA